MKKCEHGKHPGHCFDCFVDTMETIKYRNIGKYNNV